MMSIKSVRALFVFAVAAMMLGSGTTASAAEKQLLDEVKPVECQDDPACIEVKIAQKGFFSPWFEAGCDTSVGHCHIYPDVVLIIVTCILLLVVAVLVVLFVLLLVLLLINGTSDDGDDSADDEKDEP